ncbi:NAD(P)/FAD-dependent oxidoreductase [Nocardia sp. CY41]|uniref:NAD(P)/FAD-dependent oxidoreductase n=1 Tax=Nocardia sp. CY41 TaxID=2608686 RepID=UPI00135A5B20|nr:FAD-dependent monooxygenase [Nocardia sp. CY41]
MSTIRARCTTAVVAGGGLAGLLAAWVLRDAADEVVVIESDRYPLTPGFRPGTPQSNHAHLLLEAGHRALEEMLPGIVADLLSAGAVRVVMGRDLRWLSSAGWMAPHHSPVAFLSLTRSLLDHRVRARVLGDSKVQVIEGTKVIGLLGDNHAVTGVRIRQRGQTVTEDLPAQLVIDATGRNSAAATWLAQLGCAPLPEIRVDAGCAYSSRLIELPSDVTATLGGRALYLQTSAGQPWTGSLLPVEQNRYIVSLGGMHSGRPRQGEAGFEELLGRLRDPILCDVVSQAESASRVEWFPAGPSVRRDIRKLPAGLVLLGDRAEVVNPVYGQGMTLAILGAQALGAAVERHGGIGHETARAACRAVLAGGRDAWMMSTAEDARLPETIGAPHGPLIRTQHIFMSRVLHRATRDAHTAATFAQVMSLTAPPAALFQPRIAGPALLGVE